MASGSQNMTTYLAKGLEKVLTTNATNTDSLLYINTADTNITADMLGTTTSIAFTRMSTTGAYTTGHIVWLNAADIGTPFQLVVHDSSDLYLYKRWKSSGTWTDWVKMRAGTADTWTTARTLTIGNTGKSVDGSANVSWSKDEILGASTNAYFLRGDKEWSNTLNGVFTANGNITANGGMLKSTANGNTVTIGSQNTSFTHIYNSANIPFIFNNTVESTNGDLGTSSYPWHNIYIGPSNGAGIYYKGTNNTYRMIRFIDNASDIYGNGISIGGGGLAVFGAGESADTILSNLDLTAAGGTETTYISSDGSIEFYPSINSWDASARIWMTAGVLNIGVNGNTTRENSLNVYSGAGRIQLYSAASATGNRGLWVPAHGSGSAKNIIVIDTNNNATFTGNVTGNADTATRIKGNLAAATSDVNRNIWVSSTASADGIPNYISGFNINPSTKVFTVLAGTRISPSTGALYLGNSGNQSWVYVQDMCSQDEQKWKIHQNGNAEFTGTVTAPTFSGNATTATKATQDGSGNTITNKYFQIYNTNYQGNSSSVTVNDLASQGPAYGMINAATDNPTGGAGWVHVLNMAWGKTNASWIGQIALSTGGHWIKFRGNGSEAISGVAWKTCCDLESTQNFTGNKSWGSNGAGGILYGNATNGGVNSIRIGDDVYLGDCNAGGIMGMKSTGANTGFYFYNSSGTNTGQFYTNGTNFVCNKPISRAGVSKSWINGRDTAIIRTTSYNGYDAITSMKTTDGAWEMGVYTDNIMYFVYTPDAKYNSGTNSGYTSINIRPNGHLYAAGLHGPLTGDVTGNCSGSAAKLGTANKGSSNHPIYLSGGTPTECHYPVSGNWYSAVPFIHSDGMMEIGRYIDFHGTSNMTGDHTIRLTCATNTARIDCNGIFAATGWSDLAEYRRTIEHEPGRAVIPTDNGIAKRATQRLQPGARIVSDTYGFCLGESDDEQSPIALTGRVLAYPCRHISEYHAGDAVCSGPNGTVDLMTREEIQQYPDCIIGIVNEIPAYPIWNPKHTDDRQKVVFNENVEVRGRIWIDVK